jgi:hypothetical protein
MSHAFISDVREKSGAGDQALRGHKRSPYLHEEGSS